MINLIEGPSLLSDFFGLGNFNYVPSENSLFTTLGDIRNKGGATAKFSLTLTADGVAYSYASLSAPDKAFLESLDGTDLFFQVNRGGLGVFNMGAPAGQIVVVPEPSSALLLLPLPFLFLRRGRDAAV